MTSLRLSSSVLGPTRIHENTEAHSDTYQFLWEFTVIFDVAEDESNLLHQVREVFVFSVHEDERRIADGSCVKAIDTVNSIWLLTGRDERQVHEDLQLFQSAFTKTKPFGPFCNNWLCIR